MGKRINKVMSASNGVNIQQEQNKKCDYHLLDVAHSSAMAAQITLDHENRVAHTHATRGKNDYVTVAIITRRLEQ